MPRATCRRPTRDRHHSRSGVSVRPSVPPRSRSEQPFGRHARKCLDTQTHTHTQTHTAQYTTAPQVVHHRIAILELHQCTKFRVARSKFPEGEGAYANIQCTCIARALCTPSPNGMHHRITLIEHHQCTKFGVDSSKFPKTIGPLSNKLVRSWRAQPAPHRNGNHKSIYAGEACM